MEYAILDYAALALNSLVAFRVALNLNDIVEVNLLLGLKGLNLAVGCYIDLDVTAVGRVVNGSNSTLNALQFTSTEKLSITTVASASGLEIVTK